MINNYNDLKKFLETLETKPKLLLHACCGPCSTHTINFLVKYFDVTVFYDNPNIDTLEEFNKRLEELKKVVTRFPNVKLIVNDYLPETFYKAIKGYERLGEFSQRCYNCMALRMTNTYNYAEANDFEYYTTTLSISPYKNSEWINEIGYRLASSGTPKFLYSNFKKDDGYKNSIRMSVEMALYRQHYCGCRYSKEEYELKTNGTNQD